MKKTKISFNIPDDVYERIKRIAEKAEMDNTRLMVNILDETSKTLESCGKIGLLQFAFLMRNLSEKMNEWAKTINAKKI